MKKIISVRLEGDLDTLLAHWPLPEGIKISRQSSREAKVVFYDDDVVHFDALQATVAQRALDVDVDALYRAHSFTSDECEAAELLMIYGRCRRGIGFTFHHEGVPDLQGRDCLEVYAREPLPGRLIALCGTGHLMRVDLLEELEHTGLATGLHTVPTAIEIEGQGIVQDWLWISSTVDLGTPDLKHRFVKAFDRMRWGGEHWCSSSFYNGSIFIASQAIYRFLTLLQQGETCELEFEPLKLETL